MDMRGSAITASKPATQTGKAVSAKRQRAIDAAAYTFARLGYHGAGTRAIAENLGIKAASLYSHFASKDAALEEVCRVGIGASINYMKKASASGDNLPTRIRKFFEYQREELLDHCDYVIVFNNERRHLPYEAKQRIDALSREFRHDLIQMFTQAQERGELHPDLSPRSASILMIGTLSYVTQLYLEGPIRGFDDFMNDAMETFIRGITPCINEPAVG